MITEVKPIVMKCCICGREKTEAGWQYRSRPDEADVRCSHGFCAPCYESEIMKLRLQTLMAAAPLYQ